MVSSFAIECIKGTLKKVRTITYKNGQRVRRIFEPSSIVPEEVHVMAEAQGQQIEHPESVLYRHHFGIASL